MLHFGSSPWRLDGRDEELGAVAVLARVGHRHDKLVVLEIEVLVVEGVAVNAENYNLTMYKEISVTRLDDLLDFGQLFKDFGNNYFAPISPILRQFL